MNKKEKKKCMFNESNDKHVNKHIKVWLSLWKYKVILSLVCVAALTSNRFDHFYDHSIGLDYRRTLDWKFNSNLTNLTFSNFSTFVYAQILYSFFELDWIFILVSIINMLTLCNNIKLMIKNFFHNVLGFQDLTFYLWKFIHIMPNMGCPYLSSFEVISHAPAFLLCNLRNYVTYYLLRHSIDKCTWN